MGNDDHRSTPPSGAAGSTSDVDGGGMTIKECQDIIQKSFSNPKVKILVENLEKSGCKIGSNFVRAVRCKGQGSYSGFYSRGNGIAVCSNHLPLEDYVVQTVIHELIHAYDDCRAANLDWNNAAHQACSEIRANHLSGDCHIIREYLRGHLSGVKIKGHEQVCVKKRVMRLLRANHSQDEAELAVEAVWSTCYNDKAPFERSL